MKHVIKLLFMIWWFLGMILPLMDIISYFHLFGNDDILQLINRDANVIFAMILIYPPYFIGFLFLSNEWTKKTMIKIKI